MHQRRRARLARILTVGAAIAFALVALVTKQLAHRIPGAEVALVRCVIGLTVVGVAATRVRLRVNNWRGLALRGALGGAGVLCYFVAIEHLPVGVATLLNYTSPVFTALWASLFLDERFGPRVAGTLALTVVGLGLVIYGNAPPGSLGVGGFHLVGLLSAAFSGAAIATIREVRRTDGSLEIFGAFCLVGALVTAPPALLGFVSPTPREWALLFAVGVLAVIGQLLMTYALRHIAATRSGIIMQLTPVTALVLGALIFDERASPLVVLGAAITLLGVSGAVLGG